MSRASKTVIRLVSILAIGYHAASFMLVASGPRCGCNRTNGARAEVGLLEGAVETYEATVGYYPRNLDALLVVPAGTPPERWTGPYLTRGVPPDPWGHSYQYLLPGKHHPDGFDVWTVSPDGKVIGNWEH